MRDLPTGLNVLAAGAVGLNFEDADGDNRLADIGAQAEKVRAMREAAEHAGVHLVINARTDVYLIGLGEPAERFAETVRRLNAYHEAGADCLFAPGVRDAETIGRLAREIKGPLNILAGPGVPAASALEELGIARVSIGSGPARACLSLLIRIARELKEWGIYDRFVQDTISHSQMNWFFRK